MSERPKIRVAVGLAQLISQTAQDEGWQEVPIKVIEEVLIKGGKREARHANEMTLQGIHVLAVDLHEKRAQRH